MMPSNKTALAVASSIGFVGSALTVTTIDLGCIILGPECIIAPNPGTQVCKAFENAMGMLPDELGPSLIADGNLLVQGCMCLTALELDLLLNGAPDDPDYIELEVRLDAEVRQQCVTMAIALGYETYNCLTVDEVTGDAEVVGPGGCEDGCSFAGECSQAQQDASPYEDTGVSPLMDGTGDDGSGSDADGTTAGLVSCASWDPSSELLHQRGTYYVDGAFLAELLRNPSPLFECESVRVVQFGTRSIFMGIAPDSLASSLGLRNGDVPLSISGMPLATMQDFYAALGALNRHQAMTLEIERGGDRVSLDYVIR